MELLTKANAELKKTIDFLEENRNVWGSTRDFKLHETAFYDYENDFPLCFKSDKNANYDSFYLFCEDNYDFFLEWLEENNIEKSILNHIGRTSSFYLTDIYNSDMEEILCKCHYFDFIELDKNCKIIPYGEYTFEDEEVQHELEYIVKNLFEDIQYFLKDAIKVANYIDDFKKNQLEYFKEYLNFYEKNLQEEFNEIRKNVYENNNKVSEIIEKTKNILITDEIVILEKLYMAVE